MMSFRFWKWFGSLASVQQPFLALGRVGWNGRRVNLRTRWRGVETDVFRHWTGWSSVVQKSFARHDLSTIERRRQFRRVRLGVSQSSTVAERMIRHSRCFPIILRITRCATNRNCDFKKSQIIMKSFILKWIVYWIGRVLIFQSGSEWRGA